MSNYSSQLRDRRWQKKRLEILERDEFCCMNCGSSDNAIQLHVHHTAYLPGLAPWEYPDGLLISLCEECHRQETKTARANAEAWADICGRMTGAESVKLLLRLLKKLRDDRPFLDGLLREKTLTQEDMCQAVTDALHIQGCLKGVY